MESEPLLPGEDRLTDGLVMTSREWAADTLKQVANYCEYGSWPATVTAFDLGRAIGRAIVNCDETDAYKQMLRGIDHYNHMKGN